MTNNIKELGHFIFCLVIVAGIIMLQIFVRNKTHDDGYFSLSYCWFFALAVMPLPSFRYWLALSISALLGAGTSTIIYEHGPTSFAQRFVFIFVFIAVSFVVRSFSFIGAYYRYLIENQSNANQALSITDPLTGSENRRGLADFIRLKIPLWSKRDTLVTIMMFDIDSFKLYNDTFGHLEGEKCLKKVVSAIQSEFTSDSLNLFRFGGDEFVIVLEENDSKIVEEFAVRVLVAIENANINAPEEAKTGILTISMGVDSENITASYSFSAHIEGADRYLYEAKNKHKGHIDINGKII